MLEPESKSVTSTDSADAVFAGNSTEPNPPPPSPPEEFGSEVVQLPPFTERSLIGRFHRTNYHTEPPSALSARVFDWVNCGWLLHEQFYIPIWTTISETFGGIPRGDSKPHMAAKASISRWLWKARNARCKFEVDGIDVVWDKGRVWAECGGTSFLRFEWLLLNRCSELLLVDKPKFGDKSILVHGFRATPDGRRDFKERHYRELHEAMSRLPFPAAPTPPEPAHV